MEKMQTAILGASGYTGAETVRLALTHPHLDIRALTAHRYAGNAYGDVFPHMSAHGLPRLEKWDDVNWDQIDVIFACLPHGASEETVAKLAGGRRKIIDLSADFRLKDAAVYAENYGRAHGSPDLLSRAVYGLTEFARDDIKAADLIACPGCYPTASLLALLPALTFIEPDDITIDAKSGVSGAGRKDSLAFGYSEVAEGAHAYGIGSHRHGPEIDEKLSLAVGGKIEVGFTPASGPDEPRNDRDLLC